MSVVIAGSSSKLLRHLPALPFMKRLKPFLGCTGAGVSKPIQEEDYHTQHHLEDDYNLVLCRVV